MNVPQLKNYTLYRISLFYSSLPPTDIRDEYNANAGAQYDDDDDSILFQTRSAERSI